MRPLILVAFAVRCAPGNRKPRAAGFVRISARTQDAECAGTPLRRAGNVRAVFISGAGRIACAVTAVRRMKLGI